MKRKILGLMMVAIFALPVFVNAEEGIVKIGETKYPTLKDAVEAVAVCTEEPCETTTITVLANHETSGIKFASGKYLEIDLGGFTVTFKEPTVGSAGTETQDMQILKDSTITFKNGKLVSSDTESSKMFIQNYANLTLKDVEIIATNELSQYALSNNSGTVSIEGTTSIKATTVAFDVYGWYSSYADGPQVTVNTTGTIEGEIVVDDDGTQTTKELSLVIENINHVGTMTIKKDSLQDNVTIKAGSYTDEETAEKLPVVEGAEVYEVITPEGETKYVVATEEEIEGAPYEEGVLTSTEFEEILKELDELDEEQVDEEAKEYIAEMKKSVTEIRKALEGKITISAHDIYYGSFIGDDYVKYSDKTELAKAVEVVLELPTTLEKVKDGYTRKYSVVRIHEYEIENADGTFTYEVEVKVLDAKDNENGTISFESDKFSTYVLAYEDVKNVDNPDTYDGISLYIILGALSLIGVVAVSLILKKEQKA